MSNQLVIYHAHCSDGLGAAWAFHHEMPKAVYYPAIHGSPPPDVTNKEVYILDFAYSREVMLEMKAKAKSLVVLDHHKSAMEKLGDLSFCTFDMNRSGAGMAWDYLFSKRHWLIDYTEDCDLWAWKLPYSREINCAVKSYPLTFETLYNFKNQKLDSFWKRGKWKALINEGAAIMRSQQTMVDTILNKAYEGVVQGYLIKIVNTPVLQSEVAGKLALNAPFGVAWFQNEKGEKIFSLRSRKDGVDVSKIAGKYPGGGGHAAAAGFRLQPGESL